MAKLDPEFVIGGLVRRGVPLHVAQGVTARLNGESGLNPGINELAPLVAGSRGGFGLAQWTGPRRRQLESFATDRGMDVADPELQLDFLMWENANTEKGAWSKVLGAQDAVQAAELFTNHWERPGIPHLEGTLKTARQYAGISPDANALATYGPAGAPPPNALAGMGPAGGPQYAAAQPQPFQMTDMRQDPAMFMVANRRNALAQM
jgi:hypothetical protein